MVFRKEKGNDVFHRQFSAIRHQLGGQGEEQDVDADAVNDIESAQERPSVDDRNLDGGYGQPEADPQPRPAATADLPINYGGSAMESISSVPATPADIQTSVIAHDTVWQGELMTSGSLHVHGTVQGSLEASETVFVAEEADVDATITARHVIVSGFVKGAIRCSSRFEALAAGRILADIVAPSIVIHEGAVIRGEFRMEKQGSGDERSSPGYRRAGRNR